MTSGGNARLAQREDFARRWNVLRAFLRRFDARYTRGIRMHRIELPGKHHRDHLFGLREIKLALAEGLVCRLESLVIRLFILCNLIGNGFLAGQHRSDLAAKDQIRGGAGGPSVAVGKRMNPVESPQNVSSQMNRCPGGPVGVDVFAEVLDQFGYLVGSGRLVATPADFNSCRTEIPRIRTDPFQRDPMQMH